MVYLGKPSRGCQTCKARRIKCDLTPGPDGCRRCQIASRACPGYPGENDILFRNETQSTKAKVQNALIRKEKSQSTAESPDGADDYRYGVQTMEAIASAYGNTLDFLLPACIAPCLGIPIEAQAKAFFFQQYIDFPKPNQAKRGYLDLLPLFWGPAEELSPIRQAVTATAMAALAKARKDEAIQQRASSFYGQALRTASAAINDPERQRDDQTLMTVLVLALYELLSASKMSLYYYSNHIDGATALVRLRGEEQFKNPVSLHLYRAVRSQMLMNHIQGARRIGDFPVEPVDASRDPSEVTFFSVQRISLKIPELRATANELLNCDKTTVKVDAVQRLMRDAEDVDSQLSHWFQILPDMWQYHTIAVYSGRPDNLKAAQIWPGPIHQYNSVIGATLINSYRTSRLYLQAILVRCLAWLAPADEVYREGPRYEGAYNVMRSLVDDVCASVPYYLGYKLGPHSEEKNGCAGRGDTGAGAFMLVWPLFVSGSVECVSNRQRKWLKGRLEYIAQTYGFGQARILASSKPAMISGKTVFVSDDAEPADTKLSS